MCASIRLTRAVSINPLVALDTDNGRSRAIKDEPS